MSLKLNELNDRREAHLVKLIKVFLSGISPSYAFGGGSSLDALTMGYLTSFPVQDRSLLGTRRPSVFGANIYNQHLGFYSDSEETDKESEVQGAVMDRYQCHSLAIFKRSSIL